MTAGKINLLPPELRSHDVINWRSILVRGVLIASVIFSLFAYCAFLFNSSNQKDRLAEVERGLERHNKVLVELEKEKKDQQEVEKIKSFLEREAESRILWSEVMTEIMYQTIEGVTLVDIACRERNFLTIQGEAEDFPHVADFYLNLLTVPDLINVSIKAAARDPNVGSVKYTIEGQLRKGAGSSNGNDLE